MNRRRMAHFLVPFLLWLLMSAPSPACFGVQLRVGISSDMGQARASYAVGYFVEEKTGVQPDFVAVEADGAEALERRTIDLYLAHADIDPPEGVAVRQIGTVPGFGSACCWLHPEVLDDLRFFTVDRSLAQLAGFFSSSVFREAAQSDDPPRKAARQAVLDAR